MGGVQVINEISSYAETYQFIMIETRVESLKARYGSDNVTATGDGDANTLTVLHTMPDGESCVWVFEILMTGNRVKRIIIPDATISEVGDITYSSTDVIGYDVTYSANPSDLIDGATSKEIIAPLSKDATKALKQALHAAA